MLLSLALFTLFASLSSAVGTSHHKVRHKHNLFKIRDNHVNEIREAFDEYRNVLHKTKKQSKLREYPELHDVTLSDEYDDAIDNELKYNQGSSRFKHENFNVRDSNKFVTPLKPSNSHQGSSSEFFSRNKRVHATTKSTTTQRTTTTHKSIDNYDDEYEDDDNDTTNRRLNDDAQAGAVRRDVSFWES